MSDPTLDLYRVHVPLLHPFGAAHGVETVRDVVLVRWTAADGVAGWGECPTLSTFGYTDEITDTAWRFLCDVVGPAFVRSGSVPIVEGSPMAMGAVRDAQLDARLRRDGRSLRELVAPGGTVVGRSWTRVVGLDAALPASATSVKLKVTPDTAERLRLLREERRDLTLSADANGSFPDESSVPAWIDQLGLLYLEQPLPPRDLAGLAALRRRIDTPIALDESVVDLRTLRAAIDAEALDVVSLKPARVGGVERALQLVEVATEAGVRVFVGGMLETGVGRAAALALACHESALGLPPDLGPSAQYFDRDVTDRIGTEVDADGTEVVVVPSGPGIGREPLTDRLDEFAVDRATFGASPPVRA